MAHGEAVVISTGTGLPQPGSTQLVRMDDLPAHHTKAHRIAGMDRQTGGCHTCGKLSASSPACLLSVEKISLWLSYKTAIWHVHKEYMMADHSEGIYLHE